MAVSGSEKGLCATWLTSGFENVRIANRHVRGLFPSPLFLEDAHVKPYPSRLVDAGCLVVLLVPLVLTPGSNMISFATFLAIYLCGGLTFLPALFLIALYTFFRTADSKEPKSHSSNGNQIYPDEPYEDVDKEQGKRGWIRLTNHFDTQATTNGRLMSGLQNGNNGQAKRPKDLVYGVLKHGTLFLYDSDKQLECKLIVPVHDYVISIYPEGKRDHELFNRSTAIRLRPKHRRATINGLEATDTELRKRPTGDATGILKSKTDTNLLDGPDSYWSLERDLFLTCGRAIDKEDWYFALIAASEFMTDTPDQAQVETVDETHFDVSAMQDLITTIQRDPDQRQVQWLNAIMGRIFLGVYKTEKVQRYFEERITKKIRKMKRPSLLDEIVVQNVHVGHAIPYFTHPKLVSLGIDGNLEAEAHVDYAGGLCVVIETDFLWNYSSRMKPIRVHLVLSVTLKRLVGKFLFKIKAPPTNRFWLGFYEKPHMELAIKPIVSDKQIKLNLVTNAIEAKFNEVIAETMVLPNMDDFPFFDMDGRGGIFGEKIPRCEMRPEKPEMTGTSTLTAEPNEAETTEELSRPSSRRGSGIFGTPGRMRSNELDKKAPVRRAESENMGEHLHVAGPEPDVSRSSPDLLTDTAFSQIQESGIHPETSSLASVESRRSSDTAIATSTPASSIRWPSSMGLRRKKGRKGSDSASEKSVALLEEDVEIASVSARSTTSSKKSLMSKFNHLKSELSEEMRSISSESKKGSFYYKAETLWQKGKEVTRELREKSQEKEPEVLKTESQGSASQEEHAHVPKIDVSSSEPEAAVAIQETPRIKRYPPPLPPPKPARYQEEGAAPRPPLPPRQRALSVNNEEDTREDGLETKTPLPPSPPPPPVPQRKIEDTNKPALPPRTSPLLSQDKKPPIPPRHTSSPNDNMANVDARESPSV